MSESHVLRIDVSLIYLKKISQIQFKSKLFPDFNCPTIYLLMNKYFLQIRLEVPQIQSIKL
jgi:hypothetical protein